MKKKKWGCLAPLMLLLILLVMVVVVLFILRVPTSYQALKLLEHTAEQEKLAGTVSVHAADELFLEADFYWCELSDERYLCLCAEGAELYYHDEAIYFDNGRGYDLSGLLSGFGQMDAYLDSGMLLLAGFRQEQITGQTVYTLELDEQKLRLLEWISADTFAGLSPFIGSTLTLISENEMLTQIQLTIGEQLTLQAELNSSSQKSIPPEVLMVMEQHGLRDIQTLYPLLAACAELAGQDKFGADVRLNVECGPLPISDTAQVYGTQEALYFTRSGSTNRLSLDGVDNVSGLFWGLGWTLCRDGSQETDVDGASVYSLTVESGQLESLFAELLPELKGLDITFQDGTLKLRVQSGRIHALTLNCSGQMPFLITDIPMDFCVELDRMEGVITLPDGIE